jgi:iron(III) transport system substrate-binding protein
MEKRRTKVRARILLLGVAVTAISLVAAGCSSSTSSPQSSASPASLNATNAAGLAALIKQAKEEGTVVVYGGAPTQSGTRIAAAFKAAYGITVEFTHLTSGPTETKITAEVTSGNVQADAFQIADPSYTNQLAAQGELLPAKVSPPSYYPSSDVSKYCVTENVTTASVIYNTKNVPAGQVPTTINDLLNNPAWKGKLALDDPHAGLGTLAFYYALYKAYGKGVFTRLAAMNPRVLTESSAAAPLVASGEADFAMPNYGNTAALQATGAPVANAFPAPGITLAGTLCALAKAPHPAAALLLLQWTMTKAGQEAWNGGGNGGSPIAGLAGTIPIPAGYQTVDLAAVANDEQLLLGYFDAACAGKC